MIPANSIRHSDAPDCIDVFQLTTADIPSSHIYMEAQIFTPDSKRLILREGRAPHGSKFDDPSRLRLMLCDLENGGALSPIVEDVTAKGPAVSPDGRWLYYLLDSTRLGEGGTLSLHRVRLDGTARETLLTIDGPLPGFQNGPSLVYGLSTIRSDGRKLATGAFFGDGNDPAAPWGLLVFDLEKGTVDVPFIMDGTWCNLHPQYCRSTDPEAMHDLLLQHNHGILRDARGEVIQPTDLAKSDIHVVRDDGTNLRDMPWGMDGIERCQGHQCWRGRTSWAITSTHTVRNGWEGWLIESLPAPHAGHLGIETPGGIRNPLNGAEGRHPAALHFATDEVGSRLVTDAAGGDACWARIETARLSEPGKGPLYDWTLLVDLGMVKVDFSNHPHPFLSPDGTKAFFNATSTGISQAYMVTGLQYL